MPGWSTSGWSVYLSAEFGSNSIMRTGTLVPYAHMSEHAASGGHTPWGPANLTDAVVRYQVGNLDRGIEFYTRQLDFRLEQRAGPVAIVSRGALNLLLSGPESSG